MTAPTIDTDTLKRDLEAANAILAARVKTLVWVKDDDDPDLITAGDYDIYHEGLGYQVYFWSIVIGEHSRTVEDAKNFAFAHHEARILAALSPEPAPVAIAMACPCITASGPDPECGRCGGSGDAGPVPAAPATEPVASIVPEGCTAISFSFEPGILSVHKDGSGELIVPEDDFMLEDDRYAGPDGLEGSVYWIARMDAGEITALRDFLNGAANPADADLRAEVARLRETLEWYGEQARLARLIHSEGDAGRNALQADGGSRARAALAGEPRHG